MKSLSAIVAVLLFVTASTSQVVAQWTVQNSGIPISAQVVLAAVNESVCWGVTRDPGGLYITRTTNGGVSWGGSNLSTLNDLWGIAALGADTAWLAATGAIYRTTDGGGTWTLQRTTSSNMFSIRFFDSNNGVCAGDGTNGNAEIYTTTNGGTLWSPVSSSNIPLLQSEGFIPSNSWVVGSTLWLPTNGGSLYKSTDRGLTWNVTRAVVSIGGSYCAFKDTMNGLLSGSLARIVKRTTDGGATWAPTESIPAGISTLFMSYLPGTSGSYVVTAAPPHGPSPGSAITLDNGATWKELDSVQHGRAAFVTPSVGWSWGGANMIYRWTGPHVAVSESKSGLPSQPALGQNYPNPFNPTTTITYEVPKSTVVRLTVYDLLGREVAVLVNENREAGVYEVKFNASRLSSGVYFYRLQAGGYVATKKLLLMR